jgi:hypothetical protein
MNHKIHYTIYRPFIILAFLAALTASRADALETYASFVVDHSGAETLNNFPDGGAGALGKPDVANEPVLDQQQRNCSGWRESAGYLVLGFGGAALLDGAGDDLTVYHIRYGRTDGSQPPPQVYVSTKEEYSPGGMDWIAVGQLSPAPTKGESMIVRTDSFDFADIGADNIYFVRIEKTALGKYTGKFIDAVRAHYSTATDPTNTEPFPPTLSSPANLGAPASLTPALATEPFEDPDAGDTHLATRWQIAKTSEFKDTDMIYDVTSFFSLTTLTVPDLMLTPEDVIYFWRARFYDQRGDESRWSATFGLFVFGLSPQNDTDGNGIPDDQEVDYGVGSMDILDMDGNGVVDNLEPDRIKCVRFAGGAGQIGVSTADNDARIAAVYWQDFDADYGEGIRPDVLLFGLVGFMLEVQPPGAAAEVVIHLSDPLPEEAGWYHFDPSRNEWARFPAARADFSPDGQSVTLTLEDGGPGDMDGTVNGVVLDPGGPGVSTAVEPSYTVIGSDADTAAAGGCFIETAVTAPWLSR